MPEKSGEVKDKGSEAADNNLHVQDEQPVAAAVVTASPAADASAAAAEAAAVAQESTTPSLPVLVFLNSASGGKMGPKVLEKIRELIPESQ